MKEMSLGFRSNLLLIAQERGCAIPACNANTLEQAQAIIQAAGLEAAPMILQFSQRAALYLGMGDIHSGLKTALATGRAAAQDVDFPVWVHFDHGRPDEVRLAVDLGFDSVMFDGADLPFDENLALTRELAEVCHDRGVFLEAEVGDVPRADSAAPEPIRLTDPDQAAHFAQESGVDSLAVSLGSVHAVKNQRNHLDFERLAAIRSRVDCPLVLHGSSGVVDKDLVRGIEGGLCKINMATRFNQVFTEAVRAQITEDEALVDPRPYLRAGREAMVREVRSVIRLLGASGLAGKISQS